MGLYYKTDKSQYLDFVPNLPTDLMYKAIAFNEAGIQKSKEFAQQFLQKQYETFDFAQKDLDKYVSRYYEKARNILNELQKNPGLWKKYKGELEQLGWELTEDELRGTIAQYTRPYMSYISEVKNREELRKKKPDKYGSGYIDVLNAYEYQKAKQAYLSGQGVNYQKGGNVMEDIDPIEYLNTIGEFKAGGQTYKYDKVNGQWIVSTETGWEGVSPERAYQAFMTALGFIPKYEEKTVNGKKQQIVTDWEFAGANNEVAEHYLKRYEMESYINYINQGLSDKEAEEMARKDAKLKWKVLAQKSAWGLAQKYAVKSWDKQTIKVNQFALENYKHQLRMKEKALEEGLNMISADTGVINIFDPSEWNTQGIYNQVTTGRNMFGQNQAWKTMVSDPNKVKDVNLTQLIYLNGGNYVKAFKQLLDEGKITQQDYDLLISNYEKYTNAESYLQAATNEALNAIKGKYGENTANTIRLLETGARVELFEEKDGTKYYVYKDQNGNYILESNTPDGKTITNKLSGLTELYTAYGNKIGNRELKRALKDYTKQRDQWFDENKDKMQRKVTFINTATLGKDITKADDKGKFTYNPVQFTLAQKFNASIRQNSVYDTQYGINSDLFAQLSDLAAKNPRLQKYFLIDGSSVFSADQLMVRTKLDIDGLINDKDVPDEIRNKLKKIKKKYKTSGQIELRTLIPVDSEFGVYIGKTLQEYGTECTTPECQAQLAAHANPTTYKYLVEADKAIVDFDTKKRNKVNSSTSILADGSMLKMEYNPSLNVTSVTMNTGEATIHIMDIPESQYNLIQPQLKEIIGNLSMWNSQLKATRGRGITQDEANCLIKNAFNAQTCITSQ